MKWKVQGQAVVSSLALTDGRMVSVAVVAGRDKPKGAVLILPKADPGADTVPVAETLELMTPQHVTDVLCMQERMFGSSGLPQPEFE